MATRQRQKAEARRIEQKALGPSAKLRWLRVSPRKVRLVVDLIRGKHVEEALNVLTFCEKAAAEPVAKLLRSAVANADGRDDYDIDKLFVETAYVDEGSTWRRWLPRAMGRATRIRKRTSHVTLVLGQQN